MLPGDLFRTKKKPRVNRRRDRDKLNSSEEQELRPIIFTSHQRIDDPFETGNDNINKGVDESTNVYVNQFVDSKHSGFKQPIWLQSLDESNKEKQFEDNLSNKYLSVYESDNLENCVESVPERIIKLTKRRPYSGESCCTEKAEDLDRRKIQDLDFSYIPSWLCSDDDRDMEVSSLKSFNLLTSKHSKSLSDLRNAGTVSRKIKISSDNGDKINHQKIEKEYFKLKKRLNIEGDETHRSNGTYAHVQDSNRAHLSDTHVPNYRELLESDELGINHFRKHIKNVKASSKKFRRALKNNEATRTRPVPPKRKQFNIRPVYERRLSEDALGFTPTELT